MINPIQVLRDWTAVKKTKAELMDALRKTPPGAGITISDLKNPIIARSIIEILKENPNTIESIDHSFSITLMRTMAMHDSMSRDSYDHLRGKHAILTAESVVVLGLSNSAQLPERAWRGGVPDDINGTGGPNAELEAKLQIEEEERRAWLLLHGEKK